MAIKDLPFMLYADEQGRIYDHPLYRMVGFTGSSPVRISSEDLMAMPELSKLFYIPGCPPIGLDPDTGEYVTVKEVRVKGKSVRCFGVAAFPEAGIVRTHLPAVDYGVKDYVLPMWAYTAVGFKGDGFWIAGFRIEYNHRWDPRNFDDRDLDGAIKRFRREHPGKSRLVDHLTGCARENHCFAAKNLFFKRWEAPLPVSRTCNAACLGCLSLQTDLSCQASHRRISFIPTRDEIVNLAANHLETAEDAIVSFGQGCEGEPITQYRLIAESIRGIRRETPRGTINLNTNGSRPERVQHIAESGLDSIRISLSSARGDFYHAYYRPKGYTFEDVVASISLCREKGLYTMINYLVFPGVTDQEEEVEALGRLIRETGLNFIHLKNLNIDPPLYFKSMPRAGGPAMGINQMVATLKKAFPEVEFGYFNKALR
jgi:pyruvate-formate lyase-activating enzyme